MSSRVATTEGKGGAYHRNVEDGTTIGDGTGHNGFSVVSRGGTELLETVNSGSVQAHKRKKRKEEAHFELQRKKMSHVSSALVVRTGRPEELDSLHHRRSRPIRARE